MRRYMVLVWGSVALSASSLVPVWYAAQATAADSPASATAAPANAVLGPNVPQDGSGNDDFPASSRLVREIVAARPKEDLIICVAGCRPGKDRVVYAQPADPVAAPKAPETAQAPPQAQPQPQANAEPQPPAQDAAEAPPAAAAAEEKSSEAESAPSGHMEPTAAEPEQSPHAAEPATEEAAPDNSDSSDEASDPAGGEPERSSDGDGS